MDGTIVNNKLYLLNKYPYLLMKIYNGLPIHLRKSTLIYLFTRGNSTIVYLVTYENLQ